MVCPASAPTRSAAPCMRPGTAGKRGGVGATPAWSCASASTQVLSPSPIRMPRQKGADRAGLHARRLAWPGGLVRGRGWSVPGGAAAGQQLAAARPPRDPAARVCPGRHLQDPDPVPSCHGPGAPPAGRQLHQPDPAWLAQGAARGNPGDDAVARCAARCRGDPPRLGGLAGWAGGTPPLSPPAAPPDPAVPRRAWEAWQDGLAERFTLPTELPPLRLLLVWDNLTGHKNAEMVVWLCQHGVMPLYTSLGGSWLNMAESIQRILKRRALDGQHPQSPAEIGAWFQQTAQAWNRQPTPFLWHGKRRQRRRKQRGDAHALGGSGAHTQRPLSPRSGRPQECHTPRQVTH